MLTRADTHFIWIRLIDLLIDWLSPLEKGVALHLNKFESPSPKNALCQV